MKKFNISGGTTLFKVSSKKTFRIMKLSAFLLFVTVFNVPGSKIYSQNAPLNFDMKDVPMETVLNTMEGQYAVRDLKLPLVKEKVKLPLALQQNIVTGIVTEKNGTPIPGVNVIVTGTTVGAITDIDGKYSLDIPQGAKSLTFSFIGMDPQEIKIGALTQINVTLYESTTGLDEVVVIGYGEKKRANMTGSVTSVNSQILESKPITNTSAAIQGAIPGLVVTRYSGQPGAESFDLNVRGFTSANGGNSPLVLIDGMPGELDMLNPADIESISVLKDASASIYGARAAGGVFLVTTKKGKKGAARINYSSNFAVSQLAGMMETPSNYQMAVMDNEANIHNGAAPMYTPDLLEKVRVGDPTPIPHPVYGSSGWMLFFTNTDWRKAMFENGFQQKHALDVSGGNENSSYYLSATFSDQKGVIKYGDDNNKKYNLRMNYDYSFSKRVRLETKVSLENQNRTDIGGVGSGWLMTETIFGMPNHPIYTQSGDKYFAQGGWGNAVAQAKEGATSSFLTRNLNTNFKLIVDIVDGLKLNLQSGINMSSINNKDMANSFPLYTWDESSIAYYSIASPEQTWSYNYNSNNIYQNYTGYLQYNKLFAQKHRIDIMAGVSQEENDIEWFDADRSNLLSNDLGALNLGSTDNWKNHGGGEAWAIGSVFSRISYDFENKYLLEANFRYDGTSRFAKGYRWGFFPGVSVGWRLSEEGFIKNLDFFDNLKVRASYGETGNQEGIRPYDYIQLITIGRGYPYPFGDGRQDQSAYLSGMTSLTRTWETMAIKNVGLDMTAFSTKLDFSFDYFIKRNLNMLIPVTYPSLLGAVAPLTNAGELKTTGFETSLRWTETSGDFRYSARLIFSDATNVLVDYGGDDIVTLGLNNIREGYPLNTYFAYEFDGLIRTQTELEAYKLIEGVPGDIGIGDAKFKDRNGDGIISPTSGVKGEVADVINLGNTSPRYNYGLNLDVKWKGFDLGVFLQGVGKRTMFRVGDYSMPWSDWWRQPPLFYYGKTWNEDRPNAEYPRLTHGGIRWWNYQPSSLQAINAAYLRIKNVQFGYSLPESILNKLTVNKVRVYFSGFDLYEFHKVKGGWDPESSDSGFNYPFQRLYSFGLDVTF